MFCTKIRDKKTACMKVSYDKLASKYVSSASQPDHLIDKILKKDSKGKILGKFVSHICSHDDFRKKHFERVSALFQAIESRLLQASASISKEKQSKIRSKIYRFRIKNSSSKKKIREVSASSSRKIEEIGKRISVEKKAHVSQLRHDTVSPRFSYEEEANKLAILRSLSVRGMRNGGNTCYLNSCIKMLHALPGFVTYVCTREDVSPICSALHKVFQELKQYHNEPLLPTQDPLKKLYDLMLPVFPNLHSKAPQDASEFLRAVLNEVGFPLTKYVVVTRSDRLQKPIQDPQEELFIRLPVPLEAENGAKENDISLQSLLDKAPSTLEVGKKQYIETTQSHQLRHSAPEHLFLHISRETQSYNEKGEFKLDIVSRKVQVPDFVTAKTQEKDVIYEVTCGIIFLGNGSGGHYVSYQKNAQGEWYIHDDSRIALVSYEKAMNAISQGAMILGLTIVN